MYAKRPEKKASEKDKKTNIPRGMKTGFERSSGFSFDDVRVHYNSEKPAQLKAHAYTQGNNVYVAPGQEKHLPHELGHVVQQKSDMVEPNGEIGGLPLNDDQAMENDADEKAEEAEELSDSEDEPVQAKFMDGGVVQRVSESTYHSWAGPGATAVGLLGLVGGAIGFKYQKDTERKHRYREEIEKYADAACEAYEEQAAAEAMSQNRDVDSAEKAKADAEVIKQKIKVKRNYEAAIKKAAAMGKGKIGNKSLKSFNAQVLKPGDIEEIEDQNVKDALTRAYTSYQQSILPLNNTQNGQSSAGKSKAERKKESSSKTDEDLTGKSGEKPKKKLSEKNEKKEEPPKKEKKKGPPMVEEKKKPPQEGKKKGPPKEVKNEEPPKEDDDDKPKKHPKDVKKKEETPKKVKKEEPPKKEDEPQKIEEKKKTPKGVKKTPKKEEEPPKKGKKKEPTKKGDKDKPKKKMTHKSKKNIVISDDNISNIAVDRFDLENSDELDDLDE